MACSATDPGIDRRSSAPQRPLVSDALVEHLAAGTGQREGLPHDDALVGEVLAREGTPQSTREISLFWRSERGRSSARRGSCQRLRSRFSSPL